MTDQDKVLIVKNIKANLNLLPPSEAINILERIGKSYRKANSIRINKIISTKFLDMERPDLQTIK